MGITARFFILKSEHFDNRTAFLMPDNGDYLALSDLKTWGKVGQFTHLDQDYIIIRAALPDYIIQVIQDNVDEGVEPLSLEAVTTMDIVNSYAGYEYSWEPGKGLYWFIQDRFGLDLSGQYDTGSIDEEGNPIMANYLINVKIAGE